MSLGGQKEPWFRRTYDPRETSEVRLYLYGGADRVATEGPAGGPITLRVVGGPGNDAIDDSKSGGTRVYDFEGASVVKGPGTHVDRTPWKRQPAKPKETPWLEWRDWGSRTLPQYKVWWEPDPGVILAAGLAHQTWGFRKFPYASLQTVQLQYSIGRSAFKFNYDGEFRRENSKLYFVLDLQASQLENLNYFGLGNELSNTPPEGQGEDYFDVESDVYRFTPWSRWSLGRTFEVYVGPEAKWTHTPPDQSGYFGVEQPYGTGDFGQVGVRGGFDLDTRGHRLAGTVGDQFRSDGKPAQSGVRLKAEGFYYPEAWDATDAFGGVDGQLRGYLVGKRAMLAARVGGRQVWGEYPWFEAAFIGGSRNLRGYRKNRFGGDSSLYGSLEARLWLFRGRLIAPGRWGVFGLTDVGRVYLEGESSDEWHASYGGGIFFQMHTLNTIFHVAAAHGDDGTRFYVDYGFALLDRGFAFQDGAPARVRGGAARPGGPPDPADDRGRPGQPLLVDPVRAGRPARRGAADRGRPRPLGDLLQPRRPRPAERVVVPPLDGIGPVGARLHRGASRASRSSTRLPRPSARRRRCSPASCRAGWARTRASPGPSSRGRSSTCASASA